VENIDNAAQIVRTPPVLRRQGESMRVHMMHLLGNKCTAQITNGLASPHPAEQRTRETQKR